MTNTKIVEYVHEYDEQDWRLDENLEKQYFTSHCGDTLYAVRAGDSTWTTPDEEVNSVMLNSGSWQVNGTTLYVYSREDINGYIALLEKLRDEEFPEEKKEIVTFGD